MSSLAIESVGGWENGVAVEATAQDSAADRQGAVTVRDTVVLTAALDADSRLLALGGDIGSPAVERLIGSSPVAGFRKELAALADHGLDPDSLPAALLDDLPTVRLIAGYARIIEMPPIPVGGRTAAPVLNICRGWAAGSAASQLAAAGKSVISDTPPAPAFADLLDASAAVDEPALRPRSMRRRRILDLVPSGKNIGVYQYFRDSYCDENRNEGSLHEYVVSALLGDDDSGQLAVKAISVEPRSLPFPECPLASSNAQLLVGTAIENIEGTVRSRLSGTMGCTHLSDVLRFLRFAWPLASALHPSEV